MLIPLPEQAESDKDPGSDLGIKGFHILWEGEFHQEYHGGKAHPSRCGGCVGSSAEGEVQWHVWG